MNHDLTAGRPSGVLLKFCLPLLGSILFQQLYNMADSFVAGKLISNDALAAVGNSYEITLIFLAFAFGTNIGCSVVVSQLFGAKKYGDLRTAVHTTLVAGGALCAVLMVLGLVFARDLLTLIHTPESLMADSVLYLDIYVWGLPFVFFYNIATGIFSALGDSKTPLLFLACSSLSNIGVDVLFVAAFKMGVAGVAWATFLCQGVSCLLAMFFMVRRIHGLPVDQPWRIFSPFLLRNIAVIAVPSILQQSFISVGNIVIQGAINGFGGGVIAGYSAAIKLNNTAVSSILAVSNGLSNYTAQNIGAEKPERLTPGLKAGLLIAWGIAVPASLLFFFAGGGLMTVFLENPTGEAMETGLRFLRIVSPFFPVISVKLVCDGVLRGAGRMARYMIDTFTDLILRVVLALVLSGTTLGATGIWISWPIGWTTATVLAVVFYATVKWEREG